MYVGSTTARGIEHLLREVLSNSVDLALAGTATELRVRVERDGGFTVVDDGPGIDVAPGEDGVPFLTRVLTTWRDTPTADGHEPHVHLAAGLGLHVVCALTDRLEITTTRAGQTWRQRFAAGRAVSALERVDGDRTAGTTVSFRPDPAIFEAGHRIDLGALDRLLEDLAALVPGLATRLEVADRLWRPGDPAALLPSWAQQSWQLRAEDEQDALVIAFTTPGRQARATGRWLLNFRELDETAPLARSLDRAFDKVLGRAQRQGLEIVASAMMLSPEFSGPTRTTCDDPRLKRLIQQAVTDDLPALLAADPALRAALSPEGV
jgi:DNA gyrase/topoisomerase IV subunit B